MPDKALHPCRHHGCPELTRERFCSTHRQQEQARYDHERGNASQRGYDNTWQLLRLTFLQQHPTCERCRTAGRIVPATLVHHIVPIEDGGARLDPENLMSLCGSCHEEIHGRDRFRRE